MLPGMLRLVCCVCVRMPSLALLAEKLVSLLALLCLLACQKLVSPCTFGTWDFGRVAQVTLSGTRTGPQIQEVSSAPRAVGCLRLVTGTQLSDSSKGCGTQRQRCSSIHIAHCICCQLDRPDHSGYLVLLCDTIDCCLSASACFSLAHSPCVRG